ncbi:MAG: DNRLRE domain-containing protein, partial [Thermoplasmata archaeon]|nr:DNRLRE domain-containing protein [Thermoplasmata archaeon]
MGSRMKDLTDRDHTRTSRGSARLLSVAIISLMVLSSLLAMTTGVTSDPVEVDNLDDTRTVVWDFDQAENYTMSGVELDGGQARLQFMNQTFTENGPEEYCNGTMTNIASSEAHPGSLVLDETVTITTEVTLASASERTDAYMNEDRPNDQYGMEKDLRLDSETGKNLRMLLWFDMSSIPSTAVVNFATLSMYESSGGKGEDVEWEIHALEHAFDEEWVCWNKYDVSGFWDTPGGDYSSTPFARGSFDTYTTWRYMDISKLTELWIQGDVDNNGMIFVPLGGGGDAVKIFISDDDDAWSTHWPRLTVNYTVQGAVGLYESTRLGPATNATFTDISWTNSTDSLLSDEFSGTSLDEDWTWMNDPAGLGGSYNVGISSPGKLHVVGSPNSGNVDGVIESNFLYQNVTGDFVATVSLTEFFESNSMGAGIILAESDHYWLSVSKSDPGVSGSIYVTLGEDGLTTGLASIAWADMNYAFLRMTRNSTGIWVHVSDDGSAWTYVHNYDPAVKLLTRMMLGLFVYSSSSTAPEVNFDYYRVVPIDPPIFEVRVRLGNSTNPADPSWGSWGDALPGQSAIVDDTAKYLQYRVYLRTLCEWFTPMFSSLTFHSERYASSGTIETEDFVAEDFSLWHTLSTDESAAGGVVGYYYTVDPPDSWTYLGTGGIYSIRSDQDTLRVRVEITTYDTLVTPTVDDVRAMYGTALESFFVLTPSEVVAGEPFQMTVYAKDSENTTMYHWTGSVGLQALDAATMLPASGTLAYTSSMVPEGGYVILSNQEYNATGTMVIAVSAQGMIGYSAPIIVFPGPVASLELQPDDVDSVEEYASLPFTVSAFDGCGNPVPDLEYEWNVTPALGSPVIDGDSATLVASAAPAEGYVNVTFGGILVSCHITVIG